MKIPPVRLLYILPKQITFWMRYQPSPPKPILEMVSPISGGRGGGFITFIMVNSDLEKFNFISVLVNKHSSTD